MMGLKNKLMEIQGRIKREKTEMRESIILRCQYMEITFGENSVQANDERMKLTRFDDYELKQRASKFRKFLDENNEKATRAFCRLNKEGKCNDDVTQIGKDGVNGGPFDSNEERNKHVGDFYSNLFKKKLDRLLSIEDFLSRETCNEDWLKAKKLNDNEKLDLEGEVTMEELNESLKTSNMQSSSGWDGLSFKVIKKYWKWVGPLHC